MIKSGWFGETFALDERLLVSRSSTAAVFGSRSSRAPRAYTDHGIATVGQIVQDVSGQPLHAYLREHVFQPLGMATSDLLRSDRVRAGWHRDTRWAERAQGGDRAAGVTAAAGAIYSTPRDMARYLAALLGGGVGEHGSILKPETLAMMFAPHYQPDPRIPGMGLGFFRANLGGHPAVEHQGVVPGFNSQIFLAPNDGAGVMVFTNGAANVFSTLWLLSEAERLLRDLIGAQGDGVRADVPHHPEIWGELCGWYRRRAADRHDGVVDGRCRSRGRRPPWPADGTHPRADTGPIPGASAASRRPGRPVRVPGRPLAARHGHGQTGVQPRRNRGHDGTPLRWPFPIRRQASRLGEPEAAGRRCRCCAGRMCHGARRSAP